MKVDVAVIGGGPAGATAAFCLAHAAIRVALIEAGTYATPRIGETLLPAIAAPLRTLGLWEGFQALRPLPSYGVRSVWGSDQPAERSLLFDANGPAWHVDRRTFDRFLAEAAAAAGATLLTGHRFHSAEPTESGGWRLRLTAKGMPRVLEADVAIDATGRAAGLARRLGAARQVFDHRVGIIGRFAAPADWLQEAGFLLVEAVPEGWWYTAPAPPNEAVAVLVTDADLIDARQAQAWQAALAATNWTEARVRPLRLSAPPTAVLADTSMLDRSWGAGWIAIGDAACAYDPLSGDGVLRAIRDGIGAAQAMLSSDAGDWPRYAENRNAEARSHRLEQAGFARRERRWPEAAFWRREQGGLSPRPG